MCEVGSFTEFTPRSPTLGYKLGTSLVILWYKGQATYRRERKRKSADRSSKKKIYGGRATSSPKPATSLFLSAWIFTLLVLRFTDSARENTPCGQWGRENKISMGWINDAVDIYFLLLVGIRLFRFFYLCWDWLFGLHI